MQNHQTGSEIPRLLHTAAWLWIGYLLALLLIDQLVLRSTRPVLGYYLVNSVNALVFLVMAYWEGLRKWLKNAYLPVMLIVCVVFPMVVSHLLPLNFNAAHAPQTNPESMALRQLPMLFVVLVITAWQYGTSGVIVFSLGTALLELLTVDILSPLFIFISKPALSPHGFAPIPIQTIDVFLFLALVRTVSFVVVGAFISQLINRLHAQQDSLSKANARVTHYASTLESLTVSRERNRMAHELHDTLAHSLTAISVQLETVKAYWDLDSEKARQQLEGSLEATRSGLEETRRALKSLRASPLEELGLPLALQQLARSAAGRGSLALELDIPDHLPPLAPDVEQCIYRTAQEALENILRHSAARKIVLRLAMNEHEIRLSIQDDGKGFDPIQAEKAGHFGLLGMRERARMTGGELTVVSQLGQGCTIQLTLGAAV
jgi:signal transduction histidine kinase